MQASDFDKVLHNVEKYDYDPQTREVTLKSDPSTPLDDKLKRVVRMSYLINGLCDYHLGDKNNEKARKTFENILPFLNDFEDLIRLGKNRTNFVINSNDLEILFDKYLKEVPDFYSIAQKIFWKDRVQTIAEHALDKDVKINKVLSDKIAPDPARTNFEIIQ